MRAYRVGTGTWARKTRRLVSTGRRGFTLIELLVVIAIIALLVSILLPSLQKAKDLAKASMCGSQTRNMALAYLLYREGNGNSSPGAPEELETIELALVAASFASGRQ